MSGLVRSVKKVFKKITKSKVVKGLLIAAAVYFTAGIAGGMMGSTAMASLPGIKSLADTLGIESGAFGTGPPGAIPTPDFQTTALPTQPPIQETPTPDATTELARASAPGAVQQSAQPAAPAPSAPAGASAAATPAFDAAPAPAQPGAPGVPTSALSWWKNLSPAAQQILAQGFAGGAAGMMQALAAKNAQEDAEERENRMREDRTRRGSVPDFSSAFKPRKPGIIDGLRIPRPGGS